MMPHQSNVLTEETILTLINYTLYFWAQLKYKKSSSLAVTHSMFKCSDFFLGCLDAPGSVGAVMWKLWWSRQLWNSRPTAKQPKQGGAQDWGRPTAAFIHHCSLQHYASVLFLMRQEKWSKHSISCMCVGNVECVFAVHDLIMHVDWIRNNVE